jgi:N-acetyl-D-muramate 6-phosphate phosphatase
MATRVPHPRFDAVLFDFDGTLVDSAPDLAATANEMRALHGMAPAPYETLRRMVGSGARGMLGAGLGVRPGDPSFEPLRADFLQRYERRMLDASAVFPDMHAVLESLELAAMRWGVVTNKATRLAHPMLAGLGLAPRCAALVGGDSTGFTKPHPAPLLEAARRMGVAAHRCVYVGDDIRDIQAGRAAGMSTLAAAWGYLGDGEPIAAWGADVVLDTPGALLQWLELP